MIRVQYGSFFLERYTQTIRPYVMYLRQSRGISCFVKTAFVLMAVASRRISFPKDWLHTSLYFGCLSKCLYSSRSPVLSSRTE